MPEAIYKQEGELIDWTPTAAVAAGEIIQLKDGRAAFAPTAIAAGVRGAVQVCGIVQVDKVITQTMLVSNQVYWDTSASTCNLLRGLGTNDFFLGTVVEDAAYAATSVLVALNVKPAYISDLASGYHSIPIQTAGDVYVNGCGNGVNFFHGVTAEAMKVDALAIHKIATGTPGVLQALVCINLNQDNAAGNFVVGLADATHPTATDTITSSLLLRTDGNSLNLNIESDNATAEVAKTDTTLDAVVGTPFLVTWDLRTWSAIRCFINGLRVGDGTTGSAVTLTLAGVAGPLGVFAWMGKTADDSPGNITVMDLGFTAFDV